MLLHLKIIWLISSDCFSLENCAICNISETALQVTGAKNRRFPLVKTKLPSHLLSIENSFDGEFHILKKLEKVQRKPDQHCNAMSDWNVNTINNQHYLYDQHNPA